jgi:hypothetical protein
MTDKAEDVTVRLRGFIGLKNTHSLWEYAAALRDAFDCLVAKNVTIASQAAEIAGHKLHIEKLYSKLENRAREFSPGDKP